MLINKAASFTFFWILISITVLAMFSCSQRPQTTGAPPPPAPESPKEAIDIERDGAGRGWDNVSGQGKSLKEAIDMPKFPWPPPKASAFVTIPHEFLVNTGSQTFLNNVAQKIEFALNKAGYGERSYYFVQKGFALVTRLEQIYPDGVPLNNMDRWSINYSPPRVFSLSSYLKVLFTANPGHFRIIVFIVTSYPFNQSGSTVDRDEAIDWIQGGMNVLPERIGRLPYTREYNCTALIYEFEQISTDHDPVFKDSSLLTGRVHLEKAKIWEGLSR